MIKHSVGLAILATFAVAAEPVAAQGAGPPAVVPGSANSAQVVNQNREQNAGFNRVVGTIDKPKEGKKEKATARPATEAEITVGSALRDSEGVAIGTIGSVEADGAVVISGETKVKVPLVAFGKDESGLLLGITAAKFNELVAGATSSAQ